MTTETQAPKAPLGMEHAGNSLSWGTMRPEDLIPSFIAFLAAERPMLVVEYNGEWAEEIDDGLLHQDPDGYYDYPEPEMVFEYLDGLFDLLSEIAPPLHTFGSHPGDGSDYGFHFIGYEAGWSPREWAEELYSLWEGQEDATVDRIIEDALAKGWMDDDMPEMPAIRRELRKLWDKAE